jgi:streptogramin lyase
MHGLVFRFSFATAALLAGALWVAGTASAFTEFPGAGGSGMTVGADGNFWFTAGESIGRMTLEGRVTYFPVPYRETLGITNGPDGRLWFTEVKLREIGAMTTAGVFNGEYLCTRTPGPEDPSPHRITTGPDGNLWFTNSFVSTIGRIRPDGTGLAEFPTTTGGNPWYITAGPDGAMWFTEYIAGRIGRVTLDGKVSGWQLPWAASEITRPHGITAAPDGNLWFTDSAGCSVGRVSPAGEFRRFLIHPDFCDPTDIIAGPDGNLWFAETSASRIGRITTKGVVTEFQLPPQRYPGALAVGPDRGVWFSEGNYDVGGFIARLTPDDFPPPAPPAQTIPTASSIACALFGVALAVMGLLRVT